MDSKWISPSWLRQRAEINGIVAAGGCSIAHGIGTSNAGRPVIRDGAGGTGNPGYERRGATVKRFQYLSCAFAGLLISGCVDDSRTANDPAQSINGSTSPESVVIDSIDPVLPVSDQGIYPNDADGDDKDGLVITSVDGIEAVQAVSPWLVVASTFRSVASGHGDGYVDLYRYRDGFPVSEHIAFFQQSLDTCLIREPDQLLGDSLVGGPPPSSISGGESVFLNASSGPFMVLARSMGTDGQSTYTAVSAEFDRLPEEASLSIPGDVFPNVAAHRLYEPQPVQRISPEPALAVDTESVFSWHAGYAADYVKINLLAFSDTREFQGFAVTCWVKDDGSFAMPADVKRFLSATPWNLHARYSRVYARLDVANNVVVFQSNEVAE